MRIKISQEEQNFLWACLLRKTRGMLKKIYLDPYKDGAYKDAIRDFYGHNNLTSDTEPEEMLIVNRGDIINRYKGILAQQDPKNFGYSAYNQGQKDLLDKLFGDKCLPDEEDECLAKKIDCTDDLYEMFKDEFPDKAEEIADKCIKPVKKYFEKEQPSVQVEPKFDIGQKVRVKGTKQIGTIKEPYSNDVGYRVYFEDGDGGWDKEYSADELEPYTEPETKSMKLSDVKDKIDEYFDLHTEEEILETLEKYGMKSEDNGENPFKEGDKIMFIEGSDHKVYVVEKVEGISLAINGGRFYYYDLFKAAESPSKLDLSRMIRGHEGETFYSPVFGDVIFEVILENVNTRTYSIRIKYSDYYSDDCYYTLEINGCASKNGICVLFPSKELYEKYPLNPEKAWEEWENNVFFQRY